MGELPKNLSQLHIEKAIDYAAGVTVPGIQPPDSVAKKQRVILKWPRRCPVALECNNA
jgi:hypothetical protein